MKALLILISIVLIGCNSEPLVKPFIVVDIYHPDFKDSYKYTIRGANGNENTFSDLPGKHSIGDTIK